MKLLVIQQVRRGAQWVQAKKTVSAEWIRVGRNASCEIHLPDPRVALEQGMIVDRGGPVYIEGEAGSQDITRKSVRQVRLRLGEPLDVGPYRFETLEAPAGFDAALKVELVRTLEPAPDLGVRSARKRLDALGLSKRGAAWIGLAVLLVAFLLIPASGVLKLPWQAKGMDRVWDPGPVMLAHQNIGSRCPECHQVAFERVADRACLECHPKIGRHVTAQMHPAALFGGARCATCHQEHKGAHAMHRDDDAACVSCHRDIERRVTGTGLEPVSDFATGHPAFRLTLGAVEPAARIRPDATHAATTDAHLAFPHGKHLDPAGVKSPSKGRVHLDCGACHHPDASGRMFEPVSMARDCQECHRLAIEPAVTEREALHGDPAAVVAMIDEFYASLALRAVPDSFQRAFGVPGQGLLRRAGEPTPVERQNALRLASRKARSVAIDLVEVRVCKTCHEVARKAATASQPLAWTIPPVEPPHRWMPRAVFDHSVHAREKCTGCHDIARAKSLREVAMPKIEKCRECHGGSRAETGKVTSTCLLCHGFHDPRHPWDPAFVPRHVARVAGKTHAP